MASKAGRLEAGIKSSSYAHSPPVCRSVSPAVSHQQCVRVVAKENGQGGKRVRVRRSKVSELPGPRQPLPLALLGARALPEPAQTHSTAHPRRTGGTKGKERRAHVMEQWDGSSPARAARIRSSSRALRPTGRGGVGAWAR